MLAEPRIDRPGITALKCSTIRNSIGPPVVRARSRRILDRHRDALQGTSAPRRIQGASNREGDRDEPLLSHRLSPLVVLQRLFPMRHGTARSPHSTEVSEPLPAHGCTRYGDWNLVHRETHAVADATPKASARAA